MAIKILKIEENDNMFQTKKKKNTDTTTEIMHLAIFEGCIQSTLYAIIDKRV